MAKKFEGNDDWVARENGRIPSKGALAAQRASAGLGTLTDEQALLEGVLSPRGLAVEPVPKSRRPDKR